MNISRVFFCLCVLSIAGSIAAQQSACTLPEPQYKLNKSNIFSEQQEQWLGDEQADQLESEYYLLPEQDSAEVTRIGRKLLDQLPPTTIHFKFRVYRSSEANAFSTAGGYVYVSSKMITDARSEDEVAAVLSHEIGHIYTHAVAIAYTREFKALMKVDSFADRKDLADKMQLLINAPWKMKAAQDEGDAEKDETLADSVGLYAMTRAGYAPAAFAENLDRISDNHGRSVSFFRALAGDDTDMIVRVRTARKLGSALSAACKSEKTSSSSSFVDFQSKLRGNGLQWQVPATPGLKSFLLQPAMRPALDEVRFSPDGNYILAQEESAVHILSRSPLKYLFTIDAEGAKAAHFSPDSSRVTIQFPSMRVETWNIASRQRESAHELVDYKGCPVNSLSPDGRTFVCLRGSESGIGLTFIDVDSEKVYYDNKKWDEYPPVWERIKVLYSPDGRTMLLVAGHKAISYDLDHRTSIDVHSAFNFTSTLMSFVGSNKLAYECGPGEKQQNGGYLMPVCVANFPSGGKIGRFLVGDMWMENVTHGDNILLGPFGNHAAALFDPVTSTPSLGFASSAVDVYDKVFASETAGGQIALKTIGSDAMERADIPIRPLSPLASSGFSKDGQYLAYSHSSRGSLWDLNQQAQITLLRPFTAMSMDDQNRMLMRFKNSHGKDGVNAVFDLKTKKSTEGAKYDKEDYMAGGVLIHTVGMEKTFYGTRWNTEMHALDPITGAELWTRKFPHNAPDVYDSGGGSLLIVTDLLSETGAYEEGHNAGKLVKTSDVMKEWVQRGLLVEIVNARTGEIQRVIHTPTRPERDDDDRWPALYGDYLAVHGNVNNTVVYRVSDGVRTAAFYGRVLAGDGKMGLLAVNNRDQEMIVYNAANGMEVLRVTLDHLPRAARFISATNTLLVLTATQRVYSIPLGDAKTMTAEK
jgi:outer membrane protein assembly factor BamB